MLLKHEHFVVTGIIYRNVHKCIYYKPLSYPTVMFDMFDGENLYIFKDRYILEEISLTPRDFKI